MRALALVPMLVLLCAPVARAAGETFSLRWVEERLCPEIEPLRSVRGGVVHIVSDTEWELCTDLFTCPIGGPATVVIGTTKQISPRRAVFVGIAEHNAPWGGPTTLEADLVLGADGEVNSVRGTFITPAVADVYCAARGRFRTTRRTD